jgi:hypothetical protein
MKRQASASEPLRVTWARKSQNTKTGPIPVSMTSQATCPPSCSFYGAGCYAEHHWLGKSWEKTPEKGLTWDAFCAEVEKLPIGQLWRHNQAGDLPGVGERVDRALLFQLVKANQGKRGFTYTHKKSLAALDAVADANAIGFTVNVSCDSLEEVDALRATWPALPLVVTIGTDEQRATFLTPAGNRVTVCPAQTRDEVTCSSCKLCSVARRQTVVAFKAHGQSKRKVSELVQLGRRSA